MVSTYLDEKRKTLIWDQQKHDKKSNADYC